MSVDNEKLEGIDSTKLTLEKSYEMYENSYNEIKNRRNKKNGEGALVYSEGDTKKTLKLFRTMQKDIVDKYVALGGTEEELKRKCKQKKDKKINTISDFIENEEKLESEKAVFDYQSKLSNAVPDFSKYEEVEEKGYNVKENKEETLNEMGNALFVNTNYNVTNKVQWDSVPLPSKGKCYKHKMDKIPVSYLTAYDENLIVSPNLYKDGTFLDELLKTKILNSNVKAEDLVPGDRDAIILWLRGTSYGVDFPVSVTDSESGKNFETTIDLTKIKQKPFDLESDENGYFDFELPVSKDKIKFRFLTYKNLKTLSKIEEAESVQVKKSKLTSIIKDLNNYIDSETNIDIVDKRKINDSISKITQWRDSINDEEKTFTHAITNKLAYSIVSINGITDRNYINDYVMYMNVRDSSSLRKYITDNEPGLDFNIEVERPESLGGGSITMFLTLDQFIFLNIA